MTKLLTWLLLPLLAVFMIAFAIANRGAVAVHLDPLPYEAQMPVFLLAYAAALLGLLAGGLLAWWRGGRARGLAAERRREAERLGRELDELKRRQAGAVAGTPERLRLPPAGNAA